MAIGLSRCDSRRGTIPFFSAAGAIASGSTPACPGARVIVLSSRNGRFFDLVPCEIRVQN